MNDIDIDAIRQRLNAATEGPWEHGGNDGLVWPPRIGDPVSGSTETADAEFIAHARTDVPALLAKVDELTAAQDRAAKRIDGLRDYILGSLDEDLPLVAEELRNAAIDLADALAELGHPVPDEDEAPRRPVVTVEMPAEAATR